MKNVVKEYIPLNVEEKKEIWDTATFVFDTNIYLNLYRCSKKTRDILLGAFKKLKNRVWMPNHVAKEIAKNRCEVIVETNERYDAVKKEMDKFLSFCHEKLRITKDDKEYQELETFFDKWIINNRETNLLVRDCSSDDILEKILNLYDGKVGMGFSSEELQIIKDEGKSRYEKGIAPGFKDKNKIKDDLDNNVYGDLIVWKEILQYAKNEHKNIIYITNDKKEDWWYIIHGKTIAPRCELIKEFIEETKMKFNMYDMTSFIKYYSDNSSSNKIDENVIAEIECLSRELHRAPSIEELCELRGIPFANSIENKCDQFRIKIVELKRKNQKRQNAILSIKNNHKNWKKDGRILELIRNNEKNIEEATQKITEYEGKIVKLRESYVNTNGDYDTSNYDYYE